MQRFLFIGVGGSGGDTLRHLHQELLTRLDRIGIATMPSGWQFLHIDAPLVSEESEDLPALPAASYTSLVNPQLTYGVVTKMLPPANGGTAAEYAWLPRANEVHVAVQHGAGQFRAIGRALTLAGQERIRKDLKEAVHRLMGQEAASSLTRVHTAMRGEPVVTGELRDPAVIVVSSLAGGTGSGAFLDVCDLLRATAQVWAADSTALLFAPDVFQSLSQDSRQGVQANALAAVSELLAGYWNTAASDGSADGRLLNRADDPARRGPARSFIIGAGNDSLPFEEQSEVFAAVGRTLAAWAMSPSIQQQYLSYVWGNWQQAATGVDPMGLMRGNVEAPFSSLGYSSVGLGRELFHRYAAQSIGRLVAERMLHGSGGTAVDDPAHINRDTLIQRRWPSFRVGVLLDSPGDRTAGSLLDRLAPPRSAAVARVCDEIRDQERDSMYSLPEWNGILRARIGERRDRFAALREAETIRNARKWVPEVERLVLAEMQNILLTDGLPVAVGLVRRLASLIEVELVPGLEAAALQDTAWADRYAEEVERALGAEARRFLQRRPNNFPIISQRVDNALINGAEAALGRAADADAKRTAAALLADLRRFFLVPLARALEDGLEALRRDAVSASGARTSVVGQWPEAPAYTVPQALHPRSNQFLVDPVGRYPAMLTRLLHDSAAGGEEDPFYYAVKQVILGAGPMRRTEVGVVQTRELVSASRSWRPELARTWSDNAEVEQGAAFAVRTTAGDLLDRALRWCGDDQHPLGAYITQSLQAALGGDQPSGEEHERLIRFESAFTAAIRASAPLVRMDPGYQALAREQDIQPLQPLITAIPLAEGTAAHRTAMSVLTGAGDFTEELAARRFDQAGPGEIEMTTFLGRPNHLAAFQSLTRPILEDWDTHRRTGRESIFSHWRRARSLPDAVPLDPATRLSIVRGFFIAQVDKMINVEDRGRRITVLTADQSYLVFPGPTLGPAVDPEDPFDCLAALLESVSLALIAATNNDEPLRAYRRLAELGRDGRPETDAATAHEQLAGLRETARIRYPLNRPLVAERAWEIRRDIHDALDGLVEVTGAGR